MLSCWHRPSAVDHGLSRWVGRPAVAISRPVCYRDSCSRLPVVYRSFTLLSIMTYPLGAFHAGGENGQFAAHMPGLGQTLLLYQSRTGLIPEC